MHTFVQPLKYENHCLTNLKPMFIYLFVPEILMSTCAQVSKFESSSSCKQSKFTLK